MAISIPTLQLTFDKGPRNGESLQCKPSHATRIGRVVKGNTFAVKDQGISQKHLLLEFLPNIFRWAVTDLDTSNGTLVNALPIAPSTPSPLADGDIIKIGETTSISVHISEVAQADAPPTTRRRGRSAKEDAPDAEPETAAVAELTVGRSVRRGRAAASDPPPQPSEEIKEAPRVTRRRGRAAAVKDPVVEVAAVPVVEALPARRNTRRGKMAEVSVMDCPPDPVVEVVAEPVVEEAVPLRRRNTRRGKMADVSVMEPEKEDVKDCPPDPTVEVAVEPVAEEAVLPRRNTRRGKRVDVTGTEPKQEDVLDCPPDPIVDIAAEECGEVVTRGMGRGRGMGKGRGRGRGRGKGRGATATRTTRSRALESEEPSDAVQGAVEEGNNAGDGEDTQSRVLEADEPSCPVPEVAAGIPVETTQVNWMENDDGDEGGVEEVRVVEPPAEEVGDDWENMTLGQWLDRMETFLPRAINEAADEMIAELRSMASRFDAECSGGMMG